MVGMPAGRTSSIKALDKTFILQTEFLTKPRTRIVTSVALEGQVIHKVERTFDRHLTNDEELRFAENAVISQHENLAKKIMTDGADFIKQTKSISISRTDRLAVIPGVSYVADIDEKLNSENPLPIYSHAGNVIDIATAISQSSRIGAFKVAAMISEQGKFIIDKSEGKRLLVSIKPDADIGSVLKEAIRG